VVTAEHTVCMCVVTAEETHELKLAWLIKKERWRRKSNHTSHQRTSRWFKVEFTGLALSLSLHLSLPDSHKRAQVWFPFKKEFPVSEETPLENCPLSVSRGVSVCSAAVSQADQRATAPVWSSRKQSEWSGELWCGVHF